MEYRVSVTAWREAIHGSRVRSLLHTPPTIQLTKSSAQPLPTLAQERDLETSGWQFGWHMREHIQPINLPKNTAMVRAFLQKRDLYNRHAPLVKQHQGLTSKQQELQYYLARDNARVGSVMPVTAIKPYAHQWGLKNTRGYGFRPVDKSVHQERLNGRGFGWKKQKRTFWQLPKGMSGYAPMLGYNLVH